MLTLSYPRRRLTILVGICILLFGSFSIFAKEITITGQKELTTQQGQPIELKLTDFTVTGDGAKNYPEGFTLTVYDESNYSVSGTTVTPRSGFVGDLSVTIRISKGKDQSKRTVIIIRVIGNIPPVIASQVPITIAKNQSFTVQFNHITVTDPDNKFPGDFTLTVHQGENYTVSGTTIQPAKDFEGILIVSISVNDGKDSSPKYPLRITVTTSGTGGGSSAPYFSKFTGGPFNYSFGNGAMSIASELAVEDDDSEDLLYAEVYFESGAFESGKDELTITPTSNIRGAFDASAGFLIIIGRASKAEYQNALRSIKYNYKVDSIPAVNQKKIHFRLNDGQHFSEVKTKIINMGEAIVLDIPNVFSPNGDQANDEWMIRTKRDSDNLSFTVRVYNSSGYLVYEGKKEDQPWDGSAMGRQVPAGTYYYLIEIKDGNFRDMKKGVVTILR